MIESKEGQQLPSSLGILHTDQGGLVEAETLYRQALAGYEKVLGPDHKATPDAVRNLNLLYRRQDKLAEAEALYQRHHAGTRDGHTPTKAGTTSP
ncbi:MAG: hypothetical protein M1813_004764 [Trichoglossum hirsutum]|nr:MAG: hypothetical protein M1813_004764 [Trichoglossum hirsutum]